jgi:hypothetical protein
MRRGDLVVVSLPGDYGKPRPALVVQCDWFAEHPSVGRALDQVMLAVDRALSVFLGLT